MKDYRFDALISAARTKHYKARSSFTDRVMSLVQSPEILSAHVRKMNVTKKETFIMKLNHLPKFAIVAIALGALLVFSTGVYAAYQLLWPKPHAEVSTMTTSVSGRNEVSIPFSQCGNTTMAQRYELKKNATITPDQIAGVVQAQCELQAITSWANETYRQDNRYGQQPPQNKPYNLKQLNFPVATKIKSRDSSSITFTGLEKYGQNDATFKLTKDIRYIANGVDVTADKITETDPVVYISMQTIRMTPQPGCNDKHCGSTGNVAGNTLLAIVKLNLPIENYDQLAWQSLTERATCNGNEADTCLTGNIGAIDLYTNMGTTIEGGIPKEIQGVITQINGATFMLRSSSGAIFTVTPRDDLISDYNSNRASKYNNQKVKVGSNLSVRYYEKEHEHSKNLTTEKVMWVTLQLEMVSKGAAPTAY